MKRLIRLVLLVLIAAGGYLAKDQVGGGNDDASATRSGGSSGSVSGSESDEVRENGNGDAAKSAKGENRRDEGVRYGNDGPDAGPGDSPPAHAFREGEDRILEAFARGQSDFVTTVQAEVVRKLADDNDGSRHQKFIIELSGGHTLLVAHNIDLAQRVPVQVGDVVQVKGEYEFNGRGGVLHWTHKANGRNHEEGWIEHRGIRYW